MSKRGHSEITSNLTALEDRVSKMIEQNDKLSDQNSHLVRQNHEMCTIINKIYTTAEETKVVLQKLKNDVSVLNDKVNKLEASRKTSSLNTTDKVSNVVQWFTTVNIPCRRILEGNARTYTFTRKANRSKP